MSLKMETDMVFGFLDRDWAQKIIDKYPQFRRTMEIKSNINRKKAVRQEIINIRKELGDEAKLDLISITKKWQKIAKQAFATLKEIIQEEWPDKKILGYVSINPVCPRWLDSWSFSVPLNRETTNIVIAHEISHFLFFKKLRNEFSKIPRSHYESPHKEWILSEIVAVLILNDPRMIKLVGPGSGFYPKHKILMIGNIPLTEIIQGLYNEQVIGNDDFLEFMKQSLEIVNKL
jgi:hypothetical protein